jgi:hypothetical protein
VQESDQGLPRAHHVDLVHPLRFVALRLLDLEEDVGLGVHFCGVAGKDRALGGILPVREIRAGPRAPFDQDRRAVPDQFTGGFGRGGHPTLPAHDLLRYADDHRESPLFV